MRRIHASSSATSTCGAIGANFNGNVPIAHRAIAPIPGCGSFEDVGDRSSRSARRRAFTENEDREDSIATDADRVSALTPELRGSWLTNAKASSSEHRHAPHGTPHPPRFSRFSELQL